MNEENNTGIGAYHLKRKIDAIEIELSELQTLFNIYFKTLENKTEKIENNSELTTFLLNLGYPKKIRDANLNKVFHFNSFSEYIDHRKSHIEYYENQIVMAGIKKPPRYKLVKLLKGLNK